MGRFNTSDAMYSRSIANDETIGIGDHVITKGGCVARIDDTGGEGYWRVQLTDTTLGQLHKQRVAKDACTLAVKAKPDSEIATRANRRRWYRCQCGCKSVWMKPQWQCVCGDADTERGTECRTCGITILSYDVETVDPPTSPF